ncbi:MAG: glycosyltransferase [Phycisphaerales bacterium]
MPAPSPHLDGDPGIPGGAALSVVIPMYNEAHRIRRTVGWLADVAPVLSRHQSEIIFVNDGSTDNTIAILRAALADQPAAPLTSARVISLPANHGKGAAVLAGLAAARAPWTLIVDADLPVPMSAVDQLLAAGAPADVGLVVGERNYARADVRTNPLRRLLSTALRTFVGRLHGQPIGDTQCGFKLYRAPFAAAVTQSGLAVEQRWAFDLEHIMLAPRLGWRVVGVEVPWEHRDGSRLNPFSDGFTFIRDALRIARRARTLTPDPRWMARPAAPAAQPTTTLEPVVLTSAARSAARP